MNRLHSLKIFVWLAVMGIAASCTQDELSEQGTPLPEGMYPITFTAVQQAPQPATPQTRVSDYDEDGNHKSKWDGGEVIKVKVTGGGNDTSADCKLSADGSVDSYSSPMFWQTTKTSKVNAWYSNITGQATATGNTVSLTDQSNGLAYVLKADEVEANHKSGIELAFTHQLAKVRVKLEKGTYSGSLEDVKAVKVKGYTTCTIKDGEVSKGDKQDYITMRKNGDYYEANLVPIPEVNLKDDAFEIVTDTKTTKASLSSGITLAGGNVYIVTVTLNAKKISSGETIDKPGDYIMKGTFNKTVTLKGEDIRLTLQDVTSELNNCAPIVVESGTPTIIVTGMNKLKCTCTGDEFRQGGILLKNDANVVIEGTGTLNIEVSSDESVGIGAQPDQYCGNITIKGITLNVKAEKGAGIGNAFASSCGNIEIIGATVDATGVPAIGSCINGYTGSTSTCGNIYIDNSSVKATGGSYWDTYSPAIGSGGQFNGANSVCGTITIKNNNMTESQILSTINAGGGSAQKIGKGESNNPSGSVTCGKVTIISKDGTKEYPNGIN